jgi:AcrR family transcriptional regulator
MSSVSVINPRNQRMLQSAAELFLEQGFQVNMAAVASRAQVSKQTVYAHFGTKEALFHAAIDHLLAPLRATLEPDARELKTALLQFGAVHLDRLLDSSTAEFSRRLIGEAGRFPEAARALFVAGPDSVRRALATRLQSAAQRGEIAIDDADAAAELLLGLLHGQDIDRRRLGVEVREGAARHRWLELAVSTFLRAFAVRPATDRIGSDSL